MKQIAFMKQITFMRQIAISGRIAFMARIIGRCGKPAFALFGIVAAAAFLFAPVSDSFAAGSGGGGGYGGGSYGGGGFGTNSRQPAKDPGPYFREGVEAYNAGDYERAEENFDEVLDIVRRHARANYYMGLTQMQLGDYKDARRHFKRARRADDELYDAYTQLGIAYLKLGKKDDAMDELDELREALEDCRDDDCRDYEIKQIERAMAELEAAINGEAAPDTGASLLPEGTPASSVAAYRGAVDRIEAGDYAQGIAEMRRLAAVVGPNADIYNYLGYAHRMIGKFEIARHYYGTALTIDPDHIGANEYLGELYIQTGEIAKARKQLARLDRLCPAGCKARDDLYTLIAAAD